MQFENIKIISVLKISWKEKKAYAQKRNFHALSLRLEGDADFIHNNETINVKKGDIVYVPANIDYWLHAKSSETVIVIHFLSDRKGDDAITKFTPISADVIYEYFVDIFNTWHIEENGFKNKTYSIFYSIMHNIETQVIVQESNLSQALIYAIDYLKSNYTEESLTVSKLAKISGLSESYFRKQFLKITGTTPLNYILDRRINLAIELLSSGYYRVNEVAAECGFSDVKYFSRMFKIKTGKKPSEFVK